jgi:acetyl esterase/lipase
LFLLAAGLCGGALRGQEPAGDAAGELFKKLDTNGDGKLSRDELGPRLRGRFAEMDLNNDGSIGPRELRAMLRRRQGEPMPAGGAPGLPPGTKVLKDVPYVKDGHKLQKLDLYLPARGQSPQPLVIWIHGGGWHRGSKERTPAVRLLSKGFAVASIDYRLSDDAIFPAQIEDCKAAVRYLRQHAAEHGLDPDRFGAWGASAGGHLAALLATSAGVEEFERVPPGGAPATYSTKLQAAVDWFGPIDLTRMPRSNPAGPPPESKAFEESEPATAKLLGGPVHENPEKARQASPLTYISRDDPPILIMHGDRDQLVPVGQSKQFHEALTQARLKSTLRVIPGAGHGGQGFNRPEVIDQIADFFTAHLKP